MKVLISPTCLCGCGSFVSLGRSYVQGHGNRGRRWSEETRRKISKSLLGSIPWMKGKKHNRQSKRKMSIALKGKPHGPMSEETKRRLSESKKGHPVSEETRAKLRKAFLGRKRSLAERRKISKGQMGHVLSESTKRKISQAHQGKRHTKETRRKLSRIVKRLYVSNPDISKRHSETNKKLWSDPVYKKKQLERMSSGWKTCPNKPERKLRSLLNKLFPGEYKYVGDGKVWINGKNPDFINVNGQKKIIELFGDHWHSQSKTGLRRSVHRRQRQDVFAAYGYQTCVIWEYELEYVEKLREKLLNFHRDKKPHIELKGKR